MKEELSTKTRTESDLIGSRGNTGKRHVWSTDSQRYREFPYQ